MPKKIRDKDTMIIMYLDAKNEKQKIFKYLVKISIIQCIFED